MVADKRSIDSNCAIAGLDKLHRRAKTFEERKIFRGCTFCFVKRKNNIRRAIFQYNKSNNVKVTLSSN